MSSSRSANATFLTRRRFLKHDVPRTRHELHRGFATFLSRGGCFLFNWLAWHVDFISSRYSFSRMQLVLCFIPTRGVCRAFTYQGGLQFKATPTLPLLGEHISLCFAAHYFPAASGPVSSCMFDTMHRWPRVKSSCELYSSGV
ncbi:unnamed protein product [Ectocarpus sp. 13 AM-2016]